MSTMSVTVVTGLNRVAVGAATATVKSGDSHTDTMEIPSLVTDLVENYLMKLRGDIETYVGTKLSSPPTPKANVRDNYRLFQEHLDQMKFDLKTQSDESMTVDSIIDLHQSNTNSESNSNSKFESQGQGSSSGTTSTSSGTSSTNIQRIQESLERWTKLIGSSQTHQLGQAGMIEALVESATTGRSGDSTTRITKQSFSEDYSGDWKILAHSVEVEDGVSKDGSSKFKNHDIVQVRKQKYSSTMRKVQIHLEAEDSLTEQAIRTTFTLEVVEYTPITTVSTAAASSSSKSQSSQKSSESEADSWYAVRCYDKGSYGPTLDEEREPQEEPETDIPDDVTKEQKIYKANSSSTSDKHIKINHSITEEFEFSSFGMAVVTGPGSSVAKIEKDMDGFLAKGDKRYCDSCSIL